MVYMVYKIFPYMRKNILFLQILRFSIENFARIDLCMNPECQPSEFILLNKMSSKQIKVLCHSYHVQRCLYLNDECFSFLIVKPALKRHEHFLL